jgi:tetratricopeptide (TPR) repeat protein
MKLNFLFFTIFYTATIFADPLLVAVLMIKNEASVMATTLQPLVDAGIKDYFIYDTGSTDDTIQVTQEFFQRNKITNFKIVQETWIDFSASRNRALRLTEQAYPDATFMLMIDAEWHLKNGADLVKFCEKHQHDSTPIYLTNIVESVPPNNAFLTARLMRCKTNIEFVGKVHEVPNQLSQEKTPEHVFFERTIINNGEASKKRWLRDCKILLKEYEEDPNDSRTVYFLAQTYFCLEDWQNAVKWYELRATMPGFHEENFNTIYMLAKAYDALNNQDKLITNYVKAFNMCPDRIEPLIRLAVYFHNNKNFDLAYLFAKPTMDMKRPSTNDALVIEAEMYDFVRYDMISRLAWTHRDYTLGKIATELALKNKPNLEHLQYNLKYYEEKLAQNK